MALRSPFAAAQRETRQPRFLSGRTEAPRGDGALFAPVQQIGERFSPDWPASNEPPPPKADSFAAPAIPAVDVDALRAAALGKLASSLQLLELRGARLAEEARSDVLELGFEIARRILEAELRTGPEALFALVRSAVKRVGESRTVRVRLNPADAALVNEELSKSGAAPMSLAPIEVTADASLGRGDCVVESDGGSIDGRLASRLAEVRRAVAAAAEESAA